MGELLGENLAFPPGVGGFHQLELKRLGEYYASNQQFYMHRLHIQQLDCMYESCFGKGYK